MNDIFQTLERQLQQAIAREFQISDAGVSLEPPHDPAHGDMATNAAMVLSKPLRRAPRDIAQALLPHIAAFDAVAQVEIAGPGFINLRLHESVLHTQLQRALAAGDAFVRNDQYAGVRVNLEYVSANPTGPLHVGHARGAVVGDALAALLENAGAQITREYYINDAGTQVRVLADSVRLRVRQALGEDIGDIPEGCYPGEYLIEVGRDLAVRYGADAAQTDALPLLQQEAVAAMLALIRADLSALNIAHDVFTSEQALAERGAVEKVLHDLREHIFRGCLPPPKGQPSDDYEPHEQDLFRATAFGDDADRPLRKSDGTPTYFAADIAYHDDKYARGYDRLINIWGADHGGYVKRVRAACSALHPDRAPPEVLLTQMVQLYRDGQPYKMSKRAGTFITLRDVLDEVGGDVFRFMMLTRRHDAQLDFDLVKALETSKENPVFYVQYAHARICSVLRGADLALLQQAPDLTLLRHPDERALLLFVAGFPRLLRRAAVAYEPHRTVFALQELAAKLHGYWSLGKEDPAMRFLLPDQPALSRARLALLEGVALVLRTGLKLVGVTAVEEM